jgi:thioesterase domain-containing protein
MHGNALFWRHIVAHLPPDQPFYGLQARGVDGLQNARTNLPEMASAYLEEVRAVQPHGPYYLGGFSLGGEIAFEMAQQLLAAGEEVGLLALFDTANPRRAIRLAAAAGIATSAPIQAGGGRPGRLKLLVSKLQGHAARLQGLSLGEKLAYLSQDARMRLGRAYDRACIRAYRLRKKRLPADLLLKHMEERHLQALLSYAPRPYPGRVTLLRARESLLKNPLDDPLGWKPLAQGGLDVHIFNSDHRLVDEAFAGKVAEKLLEYLVQASAHPLPLPPPVE